MTYELDRDIFYNFSSFVLPEVPEPPKRSRRAAKRRRNFNKSKFKSMMDDSSETSSNSDNSTKIDVQPEKTKIYSPLSMYQQLSLDDYSLHHELKNFLLTKDQLRINGFPEESPEYPGRAILKHLKAETGSTKRHCCRCTSVFHVLPDGQYEAKEPCRYHLKKQVPFRLGHPYHGDFPCCNGNYLSKGCVTWQYHVTQESALEDVEFVMTKYKKHLSKKKAGTVFALDCEMLYTTAGMEVAKVGIVGANGLTVFESFVLPQNPILDYNTLYSGVTEKDLKDVNVTLGDVQAYLLKILNKDSILVGHGLENDLKALRLIHDKIVDTSVVFPYQHTKRHKKSLKNLALEFLNKQIQQSNNGHNCIEDARTCMELMLYKISLDLKDRPLVTQDENKNSILQNSNQPVEFSSKKYTFCPSSWPYNSCNYSYCGDSFRNNFYSGYLTPKIHQSCIY
jgi:DNA polymerase III epsilon subunit-like protein